MGQKNIPDEYKPFVASYLTYMRKVQEYLIEPSSMGRLKLCRRLEELEDGWIDLKLRGFETFRRQREALAKV